MEVCLELNHVSLDYVNARGERIAALRDIHFQIGARERVSVLGPSGCGKTTLLALLSGIRQPTSGEVLYRGKQVSGPSRERVIIFQNHALFPWKTALGNIEFVLRAGGHSKPIEQAEHYLEMVGLVKFRDSYPRELSGGMQQRVGIARALAADPDVLLLDEPFASLDVLTRDQVLEDVLRLSNDLGKTLVLVTHNIEEALFLGDRTVLLSPHPGRVSGMFDVRLHKPERVIEMKTTPEYMALEKTIYTSLRNSFGELL